MSMSMSMKFVMGFYPICVLLFHSTHYKGYIKKVFPYNWNNLPL
jgi:hypothetical protein